ncbi:HupE/UreJ family protein [Alphaproteobacteria bacterium]|nr:HupE/UreJ family protein [Alphaproteobacteria bacterium]
MFSYIKFIKLYLFIIISILLCNNSFAHEIKPSIADFTYDENYLNVEVRLNAELILSNIDASNISNTNSSPLTEIYDRYRLLNKKDLENSILESWKDISSNIDIKINSKLKEIDLIKIDTQDVNNFEISRDTLISFRVLLNQESENFTFKWIKNYGPIILRENNDLKLEDELVTEYLQPGTESDLIFFKENNFRSMFTSFTKFFVLGIQHIIPKGLDHILFIFGLFLFSSSLNKLIKQITIFTIAHSITLIFVSLSLIKINPQIVEPIIALSIVYVGLENIFKNYINEYMRYVVILFFGLLHGLGFALVLSDIGFRSSKLFLNLISFNIGIEVAQISIILFLYLLITIKFANNKYYRIAFQIPSSILIASIGLYWFIERIGFL